MANRLLSYNVRYFGHATRGLASTRSAMSRIASAIAALDPVPDLLCLQEVETRSLRSTVAHRHPETQLERFSSILAASLSAAGKRTRYEAFYFPAHAYKLSETTRVYTTGLAVLTAEGLVVEQHNTHAPHDITHRRHHPVRGFKQTRICAHVRVQDRHKRHAPIDVFNTHLSLPSTLSRAFWTEPKRLGWGPNQLEEAKNLARFVDRERASDRFVVTGDFNAMPGSPVYAHLVGERGWRDAFAGRQGFDEDALAGWPTAGFMRMRMHIDHVFTGPGLRWIDFEGTHRFGLRGTPFHGLSDHAPMVGRYAVGE